MSTFLKILAILGISLIMILGIGYVYLHTAYPDVGPPPDIDVEGTPGQIERGKYLAEHVAVCIDCHSTRDYSRFSGPIQPGTRGRGGEVFDERMGFPGTFRAKNITPHNLSDWSDGELYRIITTGVTREGKPIFPVMPYPLYRNMRPADVKAIIAYIRTLEPIEHEVPESEPDFPVNLIMRTIPKEADPMEKPAAGDKIARGKYLTTIGGCIECHTPKSQGQRIDSLYLAGGFEFAMVGGDTLRSVNLTPDSSTGIGMWSETQFVNRFKQYENQSYEDIRKVPEGAYNTLMPWTMYAGMKEEDLKAIYAYLQSIEPVEHEVVRFSDH